MIQSNFNDFVDNFKSKNPKQDFERAFLSLFVDIKDAIVGVKDVIAAPQKTSSAERAALNIKQFEKQDDIGFEMEQDNLADIKKLLNNIEINTSRQNLPIKSEDFENRDNFISSDENEAKDSKFVIDMEKKQFLMQKEQLEIVKEIRDILKPKVPGELTEQKAKPIDLFAFMNEEKSSPSTPFPDAMRKGPTGIVTGGSKDAPSKPKTTKLQKIGKAAKFGVGAAAVAGAGYFMYDAVKQLGDEILNEKLREVDIKLEAGEITPVEADKAKQQITEIHEKEMIKTISEEGGGITGSLAGGALGVKLGSFLGPVGAIGGGIAGSVAGSFIGSNLGQKAVKYYQENNVGEMIDKASAKASNYFEEAKDKFRNAKDYVQTELIPEGSKKIDKFISSVKEGFNIDSIKKKASEKIDSIEKVVEPKELLNKLIEPDTISSAAKFIGEQPGKFISEVSKKLEDKGQVVTDAGKTLVNNIVNNQSTNNYIPMKGTPRAEYNGSALDRYTDRLSMF